MTGSDYNFSFHFDYIDFEGITRSISFSDTKERYSYSPPHWEYFSARSKGWHEIKILIHNNSIDLYFDGVLLIQNHSKIERLVDVKWSSAMISPNQKNPLALGWIDNVKFTRKNWKK